MKPGMKRFYREAVARPGSEGHCVELDGRAVRTPAGASLSLPTLALAEAVAAEWAAQEDKIVPDTMPLMSLCATTIDRVMPGREAVAAEAASYAGSDLLCYRAETPVELATRQAEGWDPILDWAKQRFDVHFAVTTGIMPVDQPAETKARFQDVAAALDPYDLAATHVLTTALGSFLLALAVIEGRLDPSAAFALSRIDETYQEELWGTDEEAAARRDRLAREIADAKRLFDLRKID